MARGRIAVSREEVGEEGKVTTYDTERDDYPHSPKITLGAEKREV